MKQLTLHGDVQEIFSERKFKGHGNAVALWQCQVLTRNRAVELQIPWRCDS